MKLSSFRSYELTTRRVRVVTVSFAILWTVITFWLYTSYTSRNHETVLNNNNNNVYYYTGAKNIESVQNNAANIETLGGGGDDVRDANSFAKQLLHRFIHKPLPSIGVLMLACNRTNLLQSSLQQLVDIRAQTRNRLQTKYPLEAFNDTLAAQLQLPIIVSFDCDYEQTYKMVVEKYLITPERDNGVWHLFKYPLGNEPVPNLNKKEKKLTGYYRIARHYHWAIENTFHLYSSLQQLIIVEDDLNFSPDFFEYFLALSTLLASDPTLMCISAWNDNGKQTLIDSSAGSLLYRTEFFPGLGWMLQRSLWEKELSHQWPRAFWDDWFRHWNRTHGRHCVRPEVPRTSTSGKKGVSKGQYFEQHLKYITHWTGYYPFYDHREKLSQELDLDFFKRNFLSHVYNKSEEIAPMALRHIDHAAGCSSAPSYRVTYYTQSEFQQYAVLYSLMNDFKGGVPRTAFFGVVTFCYQGHRAYLAPPSSRKGYIKNWN